MLKPVVCLVSLVFAVNVSAHDYWFSPDRDDYTLHRGHRVSDHSGKNEVPFDPSIITSARCLNPNHSEPQRAEISAEYPVRVTGPCLAVIVTANSGYWSQTLTGTKNQGKDELFGVLRSWQALESIKRVEAWDARLKTPMTRELELVFTQDPFLLATGDKLRLIAMLDGKPVEGVTVAYDGDPRGVTGSDGRINLKIRHQGLQTISASLEQPIDSERADIRVRSTILMFVID